MTGPETHKPRLPPHYQDAAMQTMTAAGVSAEAAQALLDLDIGIFQWHRRMMKGEIPGKLIAEMGIDLELSQFSALTAVTRIQNGIGRDQAGQATIGLLAEEMNLDPSRASRLAAELIAKGFLRRSAAQDDGRKSVLELTDTAVSMFQKFRDAKWAKMIEMFRDWDEADVVAFSRLFIRYGKAVDRVYSATP